MVEGGEASGATARRFLGQQGSKKVAEVKTKRLATITSWRCQRTSLLHSAGNFEDAVAKLDQMTNFSDALKAPVDDADSKERRELFQSDVKHLRKRMRDAAKGSSIQVALHPVLGHHDRDRALLPVS